MVDFIIVMCTREDVIFIFFFQGNGRVYEMVTNARKTRQGNRRAKENSGC